MTANSTNTSGPASTLRAPDPSMSINEFIWKFYSSVRREKSLFFYLEQSDYLNDRNNLSKRSVFETFAIGQDKEVFRENFAAFPVLHFVFDKAPNSYDKFREKFANMSRTEY